ncbi:nitroreductase family protein [Agrobacterium tumefaciens]|uniref:nitroreductase family protein n=1 Tax=Agrobacterium tumefaciens TaxID=358 RepID=UPI00287C72E9|nr:nitroreductase family protein [Agrobacterium tumefaciens]MDS7598268.1 nitroreductase family protein [Agrobacterium tumefaciens]
MTNSNTRQSEFPVDPLFLDRWSPRAFDGKPMPQEDLLTILDAAHWAPSASNNQPWRFVYAQRDSKDWPLFLELLMEGNQRWAKNASALLFVISRSYNVSREGEKKPSATHSFDAGASWFSLAMQAHLLGYHAHGMAGIFKDQIVEKLEVPEGYVVNAAVAIGTLTDKSTLPDDLAEREVPSKRLPLAEVAFEGKFIGKAD